MPIRTALLPLAALALICVTAAGLRDRAARAPYIPPAASAVIHPGSPSGPEPAPPPRAECPLRETHPLLVACRVCVVQPMWLR
jgi:hypothetical protein